MVRLGVGSDVGISRTIFGKFIKYRVAWVRVLAKPVHMVADDLGKIDTFRLHV